MMPLYEPCSDEDAETASRLYNKVRLVFVEDENTDPSLTLTVLTYLLVSLAQTIQVPDSEVIANVTTMLRVKDAFFKGADA